MQLDRIRVATQRVADSEGLELVHVEWTGTPQKGVLRIFIDQREKGVSHADCQNVSEQVSALLDVEDLIPGSYMLEVASPGLDRKLYSEEDFGRFKGRRVKVQLRRRSKELGRKRFEAELGEMASGNVNFLLDGELVDVPYEDIASVNLVVEL
jgi:ribosome maturation factor RimP